MDIERLNDEEIIQLVLMGDAAGLNAILSRHGDQLVEFVRAMIGEDDRFEEAVTETIVAILTQTRPHYGRKPEGLKQLCFECAVATLRRLFPYLYEERQRDRRSFPSSNDLLKAGKPSRGQTRDALWTLEPADRELLFLRYRVGFSYNQLSDILREARVNFEDRITNARLTFRSALLEQTSVA